MASDETNPVAEMVAARDSSAVLKMSFASLRAEYPLGPVFVFEGDDDKIIYSQWIRRLDPALTYEPFPCGGKGGVLKLRKSLTADLNGLSDAVFYFVDRDFDGLRGHPEGADVFMPDAYSVENYLVSEPVIAGLLTNEYHCHGKNTLRNEILRQFWCDYDAFLRISAEYNFRIFVARKVGWNISIPKPIGVFANIVYGEISEGSRLPEDAIQFPVEPDAELIGPLRAEFDKLNPRMDYRGKLSIAFLFKWLASLSAEYNRRPEGVFATVSVDSAVRTSEFSIGKFATNSLLPWGLEHFLNEVRRPA